MRIFILEDDITRIRAFRERLMDHEVTICISVEQAINVYDPPYDLLLLDHDLADEHYGGNPDEREGTGQEFCRWLTRNQRSGSCAFIHSWNMEGARRMEATLVSAGWMTVRLPFGQGVLTFIQNFIGPVAQEPSGVNPETFTFWRNQ